MTFHTLPASRLVVERARGARILRIWFAMISLLGLGWTQLAAAQVAPACGLQPTTAVTQTAAPNSTLTFGFTVVSVNAGCSTSVSGDVVLVSNTTGTISSTPAIPFTWSGTTGTNVTFTVTMGANNGGTVSIDGRMLVGQVGAGAGTVSFTGNTTSVVAYTPATATALGTNQLSAVQMGTNVLRNGIPAAYPTRFDNVSAATSNTVVPNASGNAFQSYSSIIAAIYNFTGNIVCPMQFFDAACVAAASPINFSVTVEPTGMTAVSPTTVSTPVATPLVVTSRYGSLNFPAANGSSISWTIAQPVGGNGTVNGAPTTLATTTGGNTSVNFVATVPGTYTVTANSGCTFCSLPPFVSFNVTVTAIVKTLVVSSGNNQTAPTSTALPAPLVALARDNGVNAPGVTVNWAVTSGSATLSSPTSVSDVNGLASVSVTLGAAAGPVTITGTRADDGTAIATFTATATLVRTLNVASGNNQTAPTGSPLAAPLVALARNNGVNAPGVTVNWAVTSGSATLSSPTSVSDVNGLASVSVTLGAAAGPVTITGTRADDGTAIATFTATATLVRTLTAASGNNQTAPTSSPLPAPLVALARNNGINAPGVTVNWAVTSGSATLSSPTSVSNVNGLASISVTLGAAPGPVTITGTRADDATAVAVFTTNATLVKTLVVASGNNQSAPTSTVLPAPLVARAFNNAANAPGVTVNWAITAGSATLSSPTSVTDVNGLASVSVTLGAAPGTVTITGTRADDGTAIATFSATATLVKTLSIASGNNQSGPTGTALPSPLTALAQDNGNNAAGVTINWAVTSGSASLSSPTSVTAGSGLASVNVTLGPTAGPITITGTRADNAAAVVTFTAQATLVRTLVITSGNSQTGAANAALSLPFTVLARNNGGAAPGVGITWTVTTGSGTMNPPASTTGPTGNASSTLTLGATAGATTVTAARADDPTIYVTFTANSAVLGNLAGLTPTAKEVAKAIDAFCPRLPANSPDPHVADLRARCLELFASIGTDPVGVADALKELFADIALVQSESGLLAAQAQFDNIKARIAALRSGTRGTSFGGLAVMGSGGQVPIGAAFQSLLDGDQPQAKEAGADFSRWGFFAAGTIGRGNADPGLISPSYDFDINGLTVGADYRYSDKLIFGGTLGYTRQGNSLRGAEGNLDTNGWSVSAYSTFYHADSWYSDAVLSYGRNSYDVERRLHYSFSSPGGGTTTIDQTGKSNGNGNSLSLATTVGRDFNKGGWGFGPYFRAIYTKLDFDPMVEVMTSGVPGSGLALEFDTRSVKSLSSTLGGKLTYAHSASWGVLIPHVQLEWQHEFQTDPSAVEARFLFDPTATPFTVTGDPVDTDFFRFGVGMSFVLTHGRSGFFYYEKLISRERFSQDSLAFGIRIEF